MFAFAFHYRNKNPTSDLLVLHIKILEVVFATSVVNVDVHRLRHTSSDGQLLEVVYCFGIKALYNFSGRK